MSPRKASLPNHVKRAVEARTGAPIGARWAAPRLCRSCSGWTLSGLDDDLLAVTATVDPVPLTALGEYAAQLAHWPTYELRVDRRGGGWKTYLTLRTDSRRRRWPAPPLPGATCGEYDVLVAHRHVEPFGGVLRADRSALQPPRHTDDHLLGAPPF